MMGFQDKGVESLVLDLDMIKEPCESSSKRVEISDSPREFSVLFDDWDETRPEDCDMDMDWETRELVEKEEKCDWERSRRLENKLLASS